MAQRPTRDDLLTLAFSLYANPGAYALLVGAGASYSSGIHTAWGVLSDLCRRFAGGQGVDLEGEDPTHWYERTYGEEPTYSRLLEQLGPTPALRQALLESYFDVTANDIAAGTKQPTAAHHAIARLVAAGAVRVVITLNFDRLIEQALRAAHIEPTVVTHPSEVAGMRPLHQQDCCVIHLHGDFKNPDSMLNTETELAGYDPVTVTLLEQVLADYGLVVAGWSATHDTALRHLIEARHNITRYPLFWVEPNQVSPAAARLLDLKRGTLLKVGADEGLGRLADAVDALNVRQATHPLTVPVAVTTAKRELTGRPVAITVHDTLASAFADLHQHPDFRYSATSQETQAGGFAAITARIEESVRLPAALSAALAYWGETTTTRWWLPELARFSYRSEGGGSTRLLNVRRVAGLWLFYATGVAAVAAGKWDLVNTVFRIEVPASNSFTRREQLNSFYEPAYIFDQLEHDRGLFDRVSPLLAETLTIGPEALEEAWQTFEVLRKATQIAWHPNFDETLEEVLTCTHTLKAAERDYQRARDAGAGTGEVQTKRFEASQEFSRAHGRMVRFATYQPVHVLTADRRGPVDGFGVPLADRLAGEIDTQGDRHPMAASELVARWWDWPHVLRAVSSGFGLVGREAAFHRIPMGGGGVVASTMWLDSGRTAEERGTRVIAT